MKSTGLPAAACLALFVFAGYYKAADLLEFVPVDLTLLFGAATAGFCVFAFRRRRHVPQGSLAMLAVFLAMAVGLHWPADFAAYEVQKELRLFSLTALSAFAPFLLLRDEDERRTFFYAIALLGLVMSVFAAVEIVINGAATRLGVFNTNPILLARAAGFSVIVLFLLYWQRRLTVWVFLPLVSIALMALLASGSRGPLVALLVTIAGSLPLCIAISWARMRRRGPVFLSIAGLAVAVLYLGSGYSRIGGRFLRLLTGEWGDTEVSRWAVWQQTSELIAGSPLGVGWGRLSEWVQVYNDDILLRHPHNIFLEIAAEAGWPAATIFSLLVVGILAVSFRRVFVTASAIRDDESIDGLLLFSALAYWLICALFSGDVNDNRPLWAMLGMSLAVQGAQRIGRADGADIGASKKTLPDGKSVLHVSSAHRVSDGRISQKEAATLSAAGYDVTVLGLERAKGTTLPPGPRFVEYGVPASRLRRFLLRLPWLLGYCLKHHFDVYHLHDPDLVLLGCVLKLSGRRVVYDVHEAYPMVILDRDWIPRSLRPVLSRIWRAAEAAFVRWADLTIAAHEPVRQQFERGTVVTVHNYPITQDLATTSPAMAQRPTRVIYHGDLTEQRGLFTMIEAIATVDLQGTPELRLWGSLSPGLQKKIAVLPGMQRTQYLGWLNRERLAEELGQARAGLVLLHPTNNYQVIRPNKLYEYMAAGLPVIASDFPRWREVVEPANCGLLVDPLDSAVIARAVEYLLTHPEEAAAMGERGRKAVMAHYNWQMERRKLLAGYEGLFETVRHASARRSA